MKISNFEDNSELERIGENTFSYSLIETIDIPKSVKTIGGWSFDSSKLKNVNFEAEAVDD